MREGGHFRRQQGGREPEEQQSGGLFWRGEGDNGRGCRGQGAEEDHPEKVTEECGPIEVRITVAEPVSDEIPEEYLIVDEGQEEPETGWSRQGNVLRNDKLGTCYAAWKQSQKGKR